jgi:hypothetical protein
MRLKTALELGAAIESLIKAAGAVHQDTDEAVAKDDPLELIKHYSELCDANALIKKARKALEALEERVSYTDIPDLFRAKHIKTLTIDNVGRVTVAYKFGCTVEEGKRPEAHQWLRDSGNGSLIIETTNYGTLSAFAKHEVTEEGRELPSMFKTSLRPYTSITKV